MIGGAGNGNGNAAKRKVAVFSGNRAEYGLQFPILKALAADPRLQYYLLVSGAHLRHDFGQTLSEIEKDGFDVYEQIPVEMPEDSLLTTASAIGSIVLGLTPVLARLRPDFLIVYGDRFESFAAGIAGTQMAIPTVHIEGGDYTEGGALDDSVRHAMTKLAHLHFTTNEQAAERVRCLGEERWRVFNVGYPALDLIKAGHYAQAADVYKCFQLDPQRPIVVFTQHSVATEFDQAADQVRPSLEALERAGKAWGCQTLITWPNDDAGGRRIVEEIARLEAKGHPFIQVHRSLGRHYYHGVLNVASACVGNSSSGIKETPAFHCPCIDIGSRQQGRLRGANVINVGYHADEILRALETCLFDTAFQAQVRACPNPYGAGNAGPRIAEVLATIPVDRAFIQKQMTY